MIDEKMIMSKIGKIQEELNYLAKFRVISFEELIENYDTHTIIERVIERVVNYAIDINQHLLVELGKKDIPFDFKKSFLLLVDLGVYPREFADTISNSAGLRNILVHEYEDLDERIFYASIRECYEEYTKYCRFILDYLAGR